LITTCRLWWSNSFISHETRLKEASANCWQYEWHTARITNHLCYDNSLERIYQPSHCWDIATLDFDLFGKMKSELIDCFIREENDFLVHVTSIVGDISSNELSHIFQNWVERTGKVIDGKGESVNWQTFTLTQQSLEASASCPILFATEHPVASDHAFHPVEASAFHRLPEAGRWDAIDRLDN
jgi:hypothetical protein